MDSSNGNGNGNNDSDSVLPELQNLGSSLEERSNFDDTLRKNGQFNCKHSTIAGSKEGGCDRLGVEACHLPFCVDHASKIDPLFCSDCLSPQSIEVTREPLISEDGILHKGQRITTTGTIYKSLACQIVEMSDLELSNLIREEGVKIHEAESIREYHKIRKAHALVEQDFRTKEATRKLRGQKYDVSKLAATPLTGTTISKNNGVGKPPKGMEALANMMRGMGMNPTPENIMRFAALLASKKA